MDATTVVPALEKNEGRITYMYQCTGGKVTVGIGHAIETADHAVQLQWTVAGRPATPAEIRADWARISAEAKGMAAKHYEPLTTCRMSNDSIDALVRQDIDKFSGRLAAVLPKWDKYPSCVQAALFDMGFNLGVSGLQKFKSLIAACDAGDWETAAKECHRQGIGEPRNLETAARFRQALVKET